MNGRVIANRYRLESRLGVGGMGSVWRAEHLTLGSQVAIKLIDELIAKSPEVRERFEREAKAAASLRSPHVVQVLDYGVDEGTPYIAMELLEGESLEDRLVREERLSAQETLHIMTDVARAVGKAHDAGITHRDLKPANIFLVRNDDAEIAKVLDFGVAKQTVTAGRATQTGAMIGTPAYMSPEQAQGTKNVDRRTDLWAMGAIAFECLCGRLVFTSEAMGELILQICTKPLPVPSEFAGVPPGFDAWFAKALEREPDARFQSTKELIDALRIALSDGSDVVPSSVGPRAPVSHERTPPRRAGTPAPSNRPSYGTIGHAAPTSEPDGSRAPSGTMGSFTSSGSKAAAPARLGLGLAGVAMVAAGLAFLLLRSPNEANEATAAKPDAAKETASSPSSVATNASMPSADGPAPRPTEGAPTASAAGAPTAAATTATSATPIATTPRFQPAARRSGESSERPTMTTSPSKTTTPRPASTTSSDDRIGF
jgi:serine/threonine protein kinase